MSMRVLGPWLTRSTRRTGVAKSSTSRRRKRLRGAVVLIKSTMTFLPCSRISIPVLGEDRSTIIRPSPFAPRRKSTSRMLNFSSLDAGVLSANLVVCVVSFATLGSPPSMVMTSDFPSSDVAYVKLRVRLTTMRVRPPLSTTLTERTSPSPISTVFLPRALTTLGKSSAMRAGLVTVKPGGTAVSASLKFARTITLPPCSEEVLMDSSKFGWPVWATPLKLKSTPTSAVKPENRRNTVPDARAPNMV